MPRSFPEFYIQVSKSEFGCPKLKPQESLEIYIRQKDKKRVAKYPNNKKMAVKLSQVMQIVAGIVAVMTVWLASVDCGGKGKGGNDIILYNNNLVIRGEGGKGKGKGGGGSLVLANSHHGHKEHHEDHYGGGHHGMDEKFLMDVIGGGYKRSSNVGGRSATASRNTGRPRSVNTGTWEDLLVGGGRGSFGR